ncbi:cell division protein FtsB [Accumulibacter sp.]|uniref:cell division protein FtsB n=1 Tax=Accumulibacter sp. TaxID=2053492 RepID=UPI0028C4BBC5|nr:cell division protein FtsB [Accumulibacter sp.]
MRWLAVALVVVTVLLQHPLWLGKGGWLRVWDVDRQLQEQKENNKTLEMRNAGLDAEARDLKQGYEAIEERARFELGMVKRDEVFVQIPDRPRVEQATAPMAEEAAGGMVAVPPKPATR